MIHGIGVLCLIKALKHSHFVQYYVYLIQIKLCHFLISNIADWFGLWLETLIK